MYVLKKISGYPLGLVLFLTINDSARSEFPVRPVLRKNLEQSYQFFLTFGEFKTAANWVSFDFNVAYSSR